MDKHEGDGMSIVVVGSIALDSIETPSGRADEVLGGSAAYFAVAASYFAPVNVVAVVGDDFPADARATLIAPNINLDGLEVGAGRTFRWTGRYHENLNIRDTLDLQMNVVADFAPQLPEQYRRSPFVFLGNIDPGLQSQVLDQIDGARLIGCDTISHWIEHERAALEAVLQRVDVLVINDEEAGMLSGESNVVKAARRILDLGPKTLLIKRGEYGVLLFSPSRFSPSPPIPWKTWSIRPGPVTPLPAGFWAIWPSQTTRPRPDCAKPLSTAAWWLRSPWKISACGACMP